MPYEEIPRTPERFHSLRLEGRTKLSMTGVDDVSGFDENMVLLTTGQGELCVRGRELHIEKIDLEAGQLELQGHIEELSYDEPAASGSLWTRLFG